MPNNHPERATATDALIDALLESIPGIALLLRKGSFEIVACNSPAQAAGATFGGTCHQMVFGGQGPCRFCQASRLWETGKPQRTEVEHQGRWWDAIWAPVSEDLFVHYLVDITRRRSTEAALCASGDRYRSIVDNQSEFVCRHRDGGIVTFVNETICDYIGLKREDMLGKSFLQFVHSDFQADLLRRIALIDRDHPGFVAEAWIVLPDGTRAWHQWTHRGIFDEAGRVVEYQATGRDITRQKNAEDSLQASREKYRLIWENAPIGLGTLDQEGRVIECNNVLAQVLGAPKDRIIGFDVKTDLQDAGVRAAFLRAFAGETTHFEGDYTSVTGGKKMVLRLVVGPLFDQEGKVTGAEFIGEDITERRNLELQALRAQKLEAIATLAGGIAHDFNNLLQGVFGFLSMARLKLEDRPKALELLEQAEKALHLSIQLTSQLLTFAKGGKPVRQAFDLRPVVEDAARFALSGARSEYHLVACDDLWGVFADLGQISQVVQNLVLNADQAMPQGGVVEIDLRNHEALPGDRLPSGRYVRIGIRDHGVGISKADQARIFDPFFTTKEKGSGLGLATSYSIVRNHDGLIDVRSEPGCGSVFTVFVPASESVPEARQSRNGPPTPRQARIILMDDEEMVREVCREMLEALGHEVTCVSNGQEALSAYRLGRREGRPYDLVILDLTVRGGCMGGEEAIRLLRLEDPEVRAVVSSGYSESPVVADFRAHGFAGYLCKPYQFEDLAATLGEILPKP